MNFLSLPFPNLLDQRKSIPRPLGVSFLLAFILVISLLSLFEPIWQTNDDVGLSMMAHGYGNFVEGSPHLLVSNVLWGQFIRLLPDVFGIPGYSLATILTLFVAAWAILYYLYLLGSGIFTGALAMTMVMTPAILFPQFTVNAGLLTAAAVLGLIVQAQKEDRGSLVAACLLAYFAYLVRSKEFFLVSAIALPLVPWRRILAGRQARYAFAAVGIAIVVSSAIDRSAYNGPEWEQFKTFDQVSIPFTDYGASEQLKKRPDIISKYGYTENDLDLLRYWFFADPKIADARALKAMLEELGPLAMQAGSFEKGWQGLQLLGNDKRIWSFIVTALLLSLLFPSKRVVVTFIFFLTAMFILAVMGRPGMFRVFYPIVCLLLLAPFSLRKESSARSTQRKAMALAILFVACFWNFWSISSAALLNRIDSKQVQAELEGLPSGRAVTWGANFPYELAYPVLVRNPRNRPYYLYALGTLAFTPRSCSMTEEQSGHSLITSLLSGDGVLFAGNANNVLFDHGSLLAKYCEEHYQGQLHISIEYSGQMIQLWRVRCITSQDN